MLKEKKKIGIISILVIFLIISTFTYFKGGFKELKKNNDKQIFVEENIPQNNMEDIKEKQVTLKKKSIVVEIKGEVNKPDVYELEEDSIIKDLIEKAGGLTGNAELSNINRAKKLRNHELIYISNKNDVVTAINCPQVKGNLTNNSGKININSAQLEELKKLNGIGDAKAQKIIDYRQIKGGFNSIEDLKNIEGIGQKMFEKLKEEIEV
ncbi:ComEA family DNA-binding protein [Clostridium uliginosum]|uniref:Competence protein ComEA n=1 Tax=Clostridium uliginosum TaxID=119641 RepID=A0A1I1I348_9CLOT|nr:ComEA family DNA-binding protein [Clostridium uliginosum]SFC30455.1 competence protein ComEA [Clostridium uliginosum]